MMTGEAMQAARPAGREGRQVRGFSNPGKANLLTRGESDYTGTLEWEANFLLRRAYPDDAGKR